VTEIRFYMGMIYGTPSGTVTLAVYNGGVDQSVGGSSITVPDDLTASFQLITFTLSSHTIAEDDDIVIESSEVPATINDSNQVSLSTNLSGTSDHQVVRMSSGNWYADNRATYWCYK